MGNKPYVLWAFVLGDTVGSKSVQMMILLENFLRPESARGGMPLFMENQRAGILGDLCLTLRILVR